MVFQAPLLSPFRFSSEWGRRVETILSGFPNSPRVTQGTPPGAPTIGSSQGCACPPKLLFGEQFSEVPRGA